MQLINLSISCVSCN